MSEEEKRVRGYISHTAECKLDTCAGTCMFLSGVSGGGGGHDWGCGWGRGWDLCSGGGGTVSGGFGRVSTLDASTLLFHSWEEKHNNK